MHKSKYNIHELFKFISNRRKIQILIYILLAMITSFFEVLSISTVIPFIGLLLDPSKFYEIPFNEFFLIFFNNSEISLSFYITIIFIFFAISAGIMRILMLWFQTRIGYAIGADLSIMLYTKIIYQNYDFHVNKNSSGLIASITEKSHAVVKNIIMPIIVLIGTSLMTISIVATLFYFNFLITFSSIIFICIFYISIILFTKKIIRKHSQIIDLFVTRRIKLIQEGLGGIRDIIINGSHNIFINMYRSSDLKLRRSQASAHIISNFPKYAIEAIGITLMAIFAYFLTNGKSNSYEIIPMLAAFALGAQRLLPVIQQFYFSWQTIKVSSNILSDTLILLNLKLPHDNKNQIEKLNFSKSIRLENLSFSYSNNNILVLEKINLNIDKGKKIGIYGKTGSGKSTLIDLIIGLINPTKGSLLIDEKIIDKQNSQSWRKNISHVPQFIYLSDNTIAENIAFGIPYNEIDFEKLYKVARMANIHNIILTMKDKYNTYIGEMGVRLSGGQRQRIGIARALYKDSDLLVFDEATSSLDNETERQIMKTIYDIKSNITMLIIAHRLTTLNGCDAVIKIDGGKIENIGTYENLISLKNINH